MWAPNSWRWVVAGLAVTYAGGVLVPVNTRYKGEEVADIVERAHARLCVVADGFLGRSQLDELRCAAADRATGTSTSGGGRCPASPTSQPWSPSAARRPRAPA